MLHVYCRHYLMHCNDTISIDVTAQVFSGKGNTPLKSVYDGENLYALYEPLRDAELGMAAVRKFCLIYCLLLRPRSGILSQDGVWYTACLKVVYPSPPWYARVIYNAV